jgi:hypothetical protein
MKKTEVQKYRATVPLYFSWKLWIKNCLWRNRPYKNWVKVKTNFYTLLTDLPYGEHF